MNFLPVRPLIKYSSGDGAWIIAQRAEQRKQFKAIICALKSQADHNISKDINKQIPGENKLNTFCIDFILDTCKTVDPNKVAVINVDMCHLCPSQENFSDFSSVYKIHAAANNLNFDCFVTFSFLTELNLSSNNLKKIRIDPQNFVNLEILDVSFNELTEDDLMMLGLLRNLKQLSLCGNDLNKLPKQMSEPYLNEGGNYSDRFSALVELNLEKNNLSLEETFSSLGCLSRLKILKLAYNRLTSIPLLRCAQMNDEEMSDNTYQLYPCNDYDVDGIEEFSNLYSQDLKVEMRIPSTLLEVDEGSFASKRDLNSIRSSDKHEEITTETFQEINDYKSPINEDLYQKENDLEENECIDRDEGMLKTSRDGEDIERMKNTEEISDNIDSEHKKDGKEFIKLNIENTEEKSQLDGNGASEEQEQSVMEGDVDNNEIVTLEADEENNKRIREIEDKNAKDSFENDNEEGIIIKESEEATDVQNHDELVIPTGDDGNESRINEMEDNEMVSNEAVEENGLELNKTEDDAERIVIEDAEKYSVRIMENEDAIEVQNDDESSRIEDVDANVTKVDEAKVSEGKYVIDGDEKNMLGINDTEDKEDVLSSLDPRSPSSYQEEEEEEATKIIINENEDIIPVEPGQECSNESDRKAIEGKLSEEGGVKVMKYETNSFKEDSYNHKSEIEDFDTEDDDDDDAGNIERLLMNPMRRRPTNLVEINKDLSVCTVTDTIKKIATESYSRDSFKPFPALEVLDLSHNRIKEEKGIIPVISWINLTRLSIHDNPLTLHKSQKSSFIKELLENAFKITVDWLPPIKREKVCPIVPKSTVDVSDTIANFPQKLFKISPFFSESKSTEKDIKRELPKLMPVADIINQVRKSDEKLTVQNYREKKSLSEYEEQLINDPETKLIHKGKNNILTALKHRLDHPITYFDRKVDLFQKQEQMVFKKKSERASDTVNSRKHCTIETVLQQQNSRSVQTDISLEKILSPDYYKGNRTREKEFKVASRAINQMQRKYNQIRQESLKKE